MPNVQRDDHREPATELLTVHSPRQTVHRTWPNSYLKSTISFNCMPDSGAVICSDGHKISGKFLWGVTKDAK